MDHWHGPLLDEQQLSVMHAGVLEILEQTGFHIGHPDLRTAVLGRSGFTERDGRICISPERVETFIARLRKRSAAQDPTCESISPIAMDISDRSTWITERDGMSVRPITRDDVVAGTKLLHQLRDRRVLGHTPGVPCDVPVQFQPIEQFLIGAEYNGAGGFTSQVTDITTAEIIFEMNNVYARPLHLSMYLISPLALMGTELDILWHFRKKAEGITVGSMPIMGLTAPCDVLGAFTLAVAETIGGATLLDAVFPDIPIVIFPHPQAADLQTGAIIFGSAEWQILDILHRDVLSYYNGIPFRWKGCHSISPIPDAQAQIERTACILYATMRGDRSIGSCGQLSNDEVWSPAQLMLDLDIRDYASQVQRSANSLSRNFVPETIPAIVDSVVRAGEIFAVHDSTIQHMRSAYWKPTVLQRNARAQWEAAKRYDCVKAACDQAEALVAGFDYEPPQEVIRELRAIATRGRERLQVHSNESF